MHNDTDMGYYEEPEQPAMVAVEPLRVPGIIENFLNTFVPAPDAKSATDWIGISELRTLCAAYPPFGAKKDPLQDVLDLLASEGFVMQDVGCDVPYILAIRRDSSRFIEL